MKIRILIGLLVFLSAPVFALDILEYKVIAQVVNGGLAEKVTLKVHNDHEEPLTSFTYPFSGTLKNLSVHDAAGKLVHTSDYTGEKTYVRTTLKTPLLEGEDYLIIYEFFLDRQSIKRENTYILSTSHSLLANVKTFDFIITLPEGYGLMGQSVSPKPEKILSDGRHVILEWDLNEPIPPSLREFTIIVLYEQLLIPFWAGKEDYIYIAILTVILVSIVFLFRRLKKKHTNEKIDILKEDEQSIIRLILEKDGIDQREVQRVTDFSKTKVSKILTELEKRGAIRKEQVGRRNKIFLTKKLKEL